MGNKANLYVDIMTLHPETTGSCFLCIVKLPNKETIRFIVDCGLFQEQEHVQYNQDFPFDPDKLAFAIITHNHVDHTGRIPLLFNQGYNGKIYCSSMTKVLLPLALQDTYGILKDLAKRNHTKQLYTNDDVDTAINSLYGLDYNQEFDVCQNIKIRLLPNGHLIGASLVLVTVQYPGEKDINILFTGDYKDKNLFFEVQDIPENVKNLDLIMITEATYGYMSSSEIRCEFDDKIEKAIVENKDIVLPVFSLGRAQEILYRIRQLQEKEIINSDYQVYFDGRLAQAYTAIYLKSKETIKEEMQDFLPIDLIYVDKESRMDVINNQSKKIIITTSGMATYGPAQIYLPHYLKKENALILFTGYMAENTTGRTLINAVDDEPVKIAGLIVKKRAEISSVNEFSAHAKADELVRFLKQFKNANTILVNHGEEKSKEKLATEILSEIDPKYLGILNREYFFRVNGWGVVKTLTTKF